MIDKQEERIIVDVLLDDHNIREISSVSESDVVDALLYTENVRKIRSLLSMKNKVLNIKTDVYNDSETITLITDSINSYKGRNRYLYSS